VAADKRKMEQVFVNIFLNAIQAMPNGGKIFIRSYTQKLGGSESEPIRNTSGYFQPGERVAVVEVEDSGVGIAQEDLPKIFEPFFTTKGPQEGTGLGLSVTRNIVDMHKGYLAVKSEKNKGTIFSIYLRMA
jgi:two-component system cell cycle sensor histidine kinase/response regulator CckA